MCSNKEFTSILAYLSTHNLSTLDVLSELVTFNTTVSYCYKYFVLDRLHCDSIVYSADDIMLQFYMAMNVVLVGQHCHATMYSTYDITFNYSGSTNHATLHS